MVPNGPDCKLSHAMCDTCAHYAFNGDDEGSYTGDGLCKHPEHPHPSDPADVCEDFACAYCETPTWDLLICSIPHRTELLATLLAELDRQHQPGVGVIVYRDNTELDYGDKCQKLLDASAADYVSFFDDDDWPAEDFVEAIMAALQQAPDYVGFNVKFTENGVPQMPVIHSLQHNGWHNTAEALYRDIVHFNPIRRDLAVQGRWYGGCGADRQWADELRALGCVKTEVYIDRELHHYRHEGVSFSIPSPMHEIPERPAGYPFVTWLGT